MGLGSWGSLPSAHVQLRDPDRGRAQCPAQPRPSNRAAVPQRSSRCQHTARCPRDPVRVLSPVRFKGHFGSIRCAPSSGCLLKTQMKPRVDAAVAALAHGTVPRGTSTAPWPGHRLTGHWQCPRVWGDGRRCPRSPTFRNAAGGALRASPVRKGGSSGMKPLGRGRPGRPARALKRQESPQLPGARAQVCRGPPRPV